MYHGEEEYIHLAEALPVPNRCIWCFREPPDIIFDVSHVVPKCVGNLSQQLLPLGIVCRQCNNYFGTAVEPALLKDPFFHVIAVVLRLQHPDRMNEFRDRVFDNEHPSTVPIDRKVHVECILTNQGLTLDVSYAVKGRLVREYQVKDLAFLSRALHKIAYEALAWSIFVKGLDQTIDIFDSGFDHIRRWARHGEPQNSVRPVLRMQYYAPNIKPQWEMRQWRFHNWLGAEIDLFGDWYAVNLTSPPDKAYDYLQEKAKPSNSAHVTWLLGNNFTEIKGNT